jgi:hypothetical protein
MTILIEQLQRGSRLGGFRDEHEVFSNRGASKNQFPINMRHSNQRGK